MAPEGGPSSGEQDVLGNINRRFDELAARIESQAQELTQARNENRLLKEELVNNRRTLPTATSISGTASPLFTAQSPGMYGLREKIKLPMYKGEPARWREWKLKAQAKLQIDGHTLPTEHERIWFLFSRLEDIAATIAAPVMQTPGLTAEGLLAKLEASRGDPGLASRSMTELRALRQGNRNFGVYLQEFQRLLADAETTSWGDEQKLNMLEGGINGELLKATSSVPELPKVFEQRTAYYQKVWDRLTAAEALCRATKRSGYMPSTTSSSAGEPMDWVKTARTELSEKELRRHRERGLCFECGEHGHLSRNCPRKARKSQKKQEKAAKAAKAAKKTAKAAKAKEKAKGKTATAAENDSETLSSSSEEEPDHFDKDSGKE
jgi:hypothetical protein